MDCVLTVPAYWGVPQRQALLDAAKLAGLNPMALIHNHAAAALQYGIERDFTNKTEDVVFYDLGASSAQVRLVLEAKLVPFTTWPLVKSAMLFLSFLLPHFPPFICRLLWSAFPPLPAGEL